MTESLKWVWTVPNVMSLFRIALIPVFAVLYLLSEEREYLLGWAVGALVLSGITDMLDGWIARTCHQISEVGKVLDPIADKLTQITVMVCLAVRLSRLWPLMALCGVKELLQAIGGVVLLFHHKARAQAAQWYGKVSTVVFYCAVALFVVFPPAPHQPLLFDWNMPSWLFFLIIAVVAVCMIFAFVQYARVFSKISKKAAVVSADSAAVSS